MEILNTMVIPLILGLTFFMFGMNVMSGGLETMAGGGLERTMKKVTSNDFFGFFLGAGITVAIQSSSAFTVMLVGLVNSGLLNFNNTFGLIMGSNVGTTLTAWLLSLAGLEGKWYIEILNPSFFAPILAFIGIAMQMFAKGVALAIQQAFPCKKVGQAVIGLEVPHAHIHLIPIQKESDMLFSNPKLQLSGEEFVAIAKAINEAWESNRK